MDKQYKVNPDVSVKINSKHTNLQIENWDKNEVSIEAYLNSEKLNKEETKKLLSEWNLTSSGSASEIPLILEEECL